MAEKENRKSSEAEIQEALAYLAGFLGSHFNKFEQIVTNSNVSERK